jgi:hypothetical protein
MAFRKFIIFASSSIYIIAAIWFIGGFLWMFGLIFVPSAYNQLLPAFFFTIAGNVLLWLGNRISSKKDKPRNNAEALAEVKEPIIAEVQEQKPDA